MNNIDFLDVLKLGLNAHLEKTGSSIVELDEELGKGNSEFVTEKLAGILGDISGLLGHGLDAGAAAVKEAPQLALAASALLGTLGGGALYGIDKHLSSQDKRLETKQQDVGRLKSITDRLKNDYQV